MAGSAANLGIIFAAKWRGDEGMKRFALLLSVLAVFSLVGIAHAAKGDKAAKADKKGAEVQAGVVASVDANGNVKVTPKVKKGEAAPADLTIATDTSTVVTIDGNPGKVSDLTPGMHVKVTPKTGTATKIEAVSKPAKKGEKKKAA
jgi:hypothetical protein